MNKVDWQEDVDAMTKDSRFIPVSCCYVCPRIIHHGKTSFCMIEGENHLFIDDIEKIHPECPLPKIGTMK